eukprot:TRINITY_DN16351_c1_g1_i1.p1 TRINITY_DN16351_c1_g1~~TRINITY_DN16351_c1_g1_i1.p1  ORF type:complete len:1058 (+),score=265.08 TRINITY_DN16351_c1_g1_i1:85-3258(+)
MTTAARDVHPGHPPTVVAVVCLGVQFLYLCSYSVVIPQSHRLVSHILNDTHTVPDAGDDHPGGFSEQLFSGLIIGMQNVAFGIAVYFARYKYIDKQRQIITVSLLVSIFGSLLFAVGASVAVEAKVALFLLLLARLVQGAAAGVDFTAKNVITEMCDTDQLTVYNSYWSMACAVGNGAGPLLVFMTSLLPGAGDWTPGKQCAMPLIGLMILEAALFAIHVQMFPETVNKYGKTGGSVRQTIPMPRNERAWKIGTSVFLGFVRHMVRSAWEAVGSLGFELRFGFHPYHVSLLLCVFYFTSVPAQTLFKVHRKKLDDNQWMHAMCWMAAVGVAMLWVGLAGPDDDYVGYSFGWWWRFSIFILGSLLIYDGLSIHATVSDTAGVKFADPSDPTLNSANVVFIQILAKGFIGRSLGPLLGRLSVVGQWSGFALMTLTLLGISEALTTFVLERTSAPSPSEGSTEMAERTSTAKYSEKDAAQPMLQNGEASRPKVTHRTSLDMPRQSSPMLEPQEFKERKQEAVRRSNLDIKAIVSLTPENWETFRTSETCKQFALLKHGNSEALQAAGRKVAQGLRQHGTLAAWLQDAARFCIIAPAYRKVPTAGVYLIREIQSELARTIGQPVRVMFVQRESITKGDFATMSMCERRSTLKNQFYLKEDDLADVRGRSCIVIDDAIMFGSHALETCRVLIEAGVEKQQIVPFYYLEASPELLLQCPQVEHELNEAFEGTREDLQAIIRQTQVPVTLRLVKRLLKMTGEDLDFLVDWMNTSRPDVLKIIQKAAKDDGLPDQHRFKPAAKNGEARPSMGKELSNGNGAVTNGNGATDGHGPVTGGAQPQVVLVRHGQSSANLVKEDDVYQYLYNKFVAPDLLDAPVTEKGEAAACKLGVDLFGASGQGIDVSKIRLIIVSPLRRALQTAACVMKAAGDRLPANCRVVAHPAAVESLFKPDISENCPAQETLPIAELAGLPIELTEYKEWAIETKPIADPKQTPTRITSQQSKARAQKLMDYIANAGLKQGETCMVFTHWGVVKTLTGVDVQPATAVISNDGHDWAVFGETAS